MMGTEKPKAELLLDGVDRRQISCKRGCAVID